MEPRTYDVTYWYESSLSPELDERMIFRIEAFSPGGAGARFADVFGKHVEIVSVKELVEVERK